MVLSRKNIRLASILSIVFIAYYFLSQPNGPSFSQSFPSTLPDPVQSGSKPEPPTVVKFSSGPPRQPFPAKHGHHRIPIPPPPTESLTSTFRPTWQLGNIEGYNVFENLYLYGGQLVAATELDAEPIDDDRVATSQEGKPKTFVHAKDGHTWWKKTVAAMSDSAIHPAEARVLEGVAVIYHDDAGPAGLMVHYVLRALSLAGIKDVPSRLIFPHCEVSPNEESWKDGSGLNSWLVNVTLPGAQLIHSPDWEAYQESGDIIMFDKVVVVDRWAAHKAIETHHWSKMMSKMATLPLDTHKAAGPLTWFEPYRTTALDMLGAEVEITNERPVVVYLTRESSHLAPSLSRDAYQDLVKSLRRLANHAEVHLTIVGNVEKEDLIPLLAKTNVLISHKGDDLMTTSFWLPPGATVIEIFDENSFVRVNEMMSGLLGFKHVIVRNDQVYEKSNWLVDGQTQSEDWDSTELPLKGSVVERVVRDALELSPA
ncbi:Glycosyltransferase AER61, uncharacterised [Phaffia rhodozyma]|uniref:Glycosyltransferase AER61, uncharacterized n=1 Tax=Phaffia rhodozyma TaxID=264483 RepID=A0A0F7SK97_PHARH|nr:Glycosyltransferase AER61, uncharacterised [Phaffia rhodozyma]